MEPRELKDTLERMREYFNRSTRPLGEEHSKFAPSEGVFTVAGQVAHVAQTVEWFFGAAFGDEWQMDFEALDRQTHSVTSLAEARAWFEKAVERAICVAETHTATHTIRISRGCGWKERLSSPLQPGSS
jgi:hypothetical protein